MTVAISRPAVLVAVCATLTALISGCGSGPSQVGAAAIVGDKTITLDDVQRDVQWVVNNLPGGAELAKQHKVDLISRSILRHRVEHQLLTVAAQRDGIRIDDAQVTELINGSGGEQKIAAALATSEPPDPEIPERIRDLAWDQLAFEQLGAKYMNRLAVTFDATVIVDEAPGSNLKRKAETLAQQIIADPAHAKDLLKQGAGTSGQVVVDQRWSPADAERKQATELATGPLFSAPAGSAVAVKVGGRSTAWLVAYIRARDTNATPPAGQQVNPGQQSTQVNLGRRLLAPLAAEYGLKINPRFGVWDPVGLEIAPRPEEVAGQIFAGQPVKP